MTTTDRRYGVNGSLAFKAPVRLATTANITLSGLQSIDGVTTAADDRVLVKNQTDTTENGLYNASSSAWTRCADANGNRDLVTGTAVYVTAGSTNANSFWSITSAAPTVGTDSIVWAVSVAAGSLAAQLADTSSASLGDALIGVKRTEAGAASRTQHSKNLDHPTLEDFGAVGDGVTDDTTAWQAAIDSGVETVHGTPGKTYLINGLAASSPTTVGSGVRYALYYSGTASFNFIGNGATILRTDITYGTGVDEFFKIITTGSVSFTDWHLVGHGTPGSTAGAGRPIQYAFHLETTNGSRIERNTFEWVGITELYGCTNTSISDNLYTDTSGIVNTFKHGASTYTDGLVIRGNKAYRSEFDVIDLNDATKNFVIEGNYLEDANIRDDGTTDWDEFIDIGGTSLPISDGVICNNIIRETDGKPTRGIYLKQYSTRIVVSNNLLIWESTATKRAENDGITLNFAGDDITITGNQIIGFDSGVIVRNNPNGARYVITGNKIVNIDESGIWIDGSANALIGSNQIVNESGSITTTLYGIRVDNPEACTIEGNLVDLNAAADSFGIMVLGEDALRANAVKNNTVVGCGVGIYHQGGSCSYVANTITRCYGGAFNATNGGKSVHFVGNYMADNFRNTSPEDVSGLTSTYTVEIAEIVRVVYSDNIITENDLNVEPGTVRITAGTAGHTLLAIGNVCTADTSAPAITSPVAFTSVSTGNNIPAYAVVP